MKSSKVKQMCENAFDELVEKIEAGKSEQMIKYLDFLSRFHRYSLANSLLIHKQMPKAMRVAGFRTWNKLGRHVKKGQRGIAIMAPVIYHKKQVDQFEDTNKEDEDIIKAFRVVYVFDISQTEGRTLPQFQKVKGKPGQYLQKLKDYISSKGISIEYSDSLCGAEGLSCKGKIKLKSDLSDAEQFSVLTHELAHEFLHQEQSDDLDKRTVETEAEAVAYIIAQNTGLDSGTSSSDYIQLYKGDKDGLLGSMQRIHKTSSRILANLLNPQEKKLTAQAA